MSNVPYITPSQQLSLSNEFFRLHATYARDVVIFQTATETVVYSNPNENTLFENAPFNSTTNIIINSGVFKARILYGKKQESSLFSTPQRDGAGTQNVIYLEEGEVRLRVDATGAAYLASCQRVTFDDTIFNVETSPRPHSLIGTPNFFDFYLKKIQ